MPIERRESSAVPVGMRILCVASLVLPALLVGMAGATTARAQGADAPAAGFTFDTRPTALVLRFVEMPGELAAAEGRLALELYGDGRVVVERPRPMRNGGVRAGHLGPERMRALLASLRELGVTRFDVERTRAAMAASDRARAAGPRGPVLIEVSDPATIAIEIELAEPGGSSRRHSIRWRGLRSDRRHYAEVAAVQDLARACEEIRTLIAELADAP